MNGCTVWRCVQLCSFDQMTAPKQEASALRAGDRLASGNAHQIIAELAELEQVLQWRHIRRCVNERRNLAPLCDLHELTSADLPKRLTQIKEREHRGLGANRCFEFLYCCG